MVDFEPFEVVEIWIESNLVISALTNTYLDDGIQIIICGEFVHHQYELEQTEQKYPMMLKYIIGLNYFDW